MTDTIVGGTFLQSEKKDSWPKSFFTRCLFSPRKGADPIFGLVEGNDMIYAWLDSYAIIPREEYDRLKALDNEN